MATFNSINIPLNTGNELSDYILIDHIDNTGRHNTKKTKIQNLPIAIATDMTFGGVKTGYIEDAEDDGLYALKQDENGNGYFTVTWTDRYILGAEYNPELSAIQVLINDKGGPKVLTIDVKGLIDIHYGDGRTVLVKDNVFSIIPDTFLSGDYVTTDGQDRKHPVLFRNRDGYEFSHINQKLGPGETPERNRLYYDTEGEKLVFGR